MTRFPREDYGPLTLYDPGRSSVSVDLSDTTNLWGPHPAALVAIQNAPAATLCRYPSAYGEDLKAALSTRHGLPRGSIVTGCGSGDLLDSVLRASAPPPGCVSYPSPSYAMVETLARMNGMKAVPVEWQKAEIDPARLLLEEPDLVYLCRPNNPTGWTASRDWARGLLALGGPSGPLVVLDEAYADFAEDSFLHEAPDTERLIVLRTFSILYGIAGLRVGYAVGPEEVMVEVEKSRGPFKVSSAAERATVAALSHDDEWIQREAGEVLGNRARLDEELRARGLDPLPSQGNFLLIPVEPASALEVDRALREHGVAVRPFPGLPQIGDAVRVTIGPWKLMERFLSALDRLLVGGSQP